jgi:hypothetical protein
VRTSPSLGVPGGPSHRVVHLPGPGPRVGHASRSAGRVFDRWVMALVVLLVAVVLLTAVNAVRSGSGESSPFPVPSPRPLSSLG